MARNPGATETENSSIPFTTREELLAVWSGWRRLLDTLSSLTPDDLTKSVTIRGEPHAVPLAIQRALGHCCYHIGQIVILARVLAGENWNTLTIPRGASANFNQRVWGKEREPSRPSDAP